MAYVIAEPCVGTKDTACVDVCPVDCIHPRKDEPNYAEETQLYISPSECIDCGACVPECPVEAIIENPKEDPKYTEINAQYAPLWKKNPMPEVRPATDPPRRGNVY